MKHAKGKSDKKSQTKISSTNPSRDINFLLLFIFIKNAKEYLKGECNIAQNKISQNRPFSISDKVKSSRDQNLNVEECIEN
jgi:hypothetical protein